MKKFLLLIWDENRFNQLSPAEMQAVVEKYSAWAKKLKQNNDLVDAEGLSRECRVIRPTGNGVVVSDGPFAETKEAIGGYFIFNAPSFDDAVEIAKECPTLTYGGSVELRPVMDY